MLQAVYQAQLLDHYRNPRNKGLVSDPDFLTDELNPSCGDRVTLSGKIADGKIVQLGFEGSGCVISQAAASLLYEYALNKSCADLLALNADAMQKLIGVELGPVRLKCALLPLEALQKGIYQCAAKKN
ncbi:MAG: iron-sulfur cluster assembly scaffold protein [Candidatus Babeliales bacterium]